jgi:hypothetical protein
MKRASTLRLELPDIGPDSFADVPAQTAIRLEMAGLRSWLADHGVDPREELEHADAGSRDRLYWRCGYYAGLKQALILLTGGDATLH